MMPIPQVGVIMRRCVTILFCIVAVVSATTDNANAEEPDASAQAVAADIAEEISLNHQLDTLYSKGQYRDALPLALRYVALTERTGGAHRRSITISRHMLGRIYANLAQPDMAVPAFERALAACSAVPEYEYEDCSSILVDLADTYVQTGQLDAALTVHARALKMAEQHYGSDHVLTAIALASMAEIHAELGDFRAALPYALRAVAIDEKYLSASASSSTSDLALLATIYEGLGQRERALALLKRVHAVSNSPHSLYGLAMWNLGGGNYLNALQQLQEVLGQVEAKAGQDDLDTVSCLANLASSYTILQDHDMALPLLKRALSAGTITHSSPVYRLVLRTLAEYYKGANNPAAAILFYKLAVNAVQGIRANARPLPLYLQQSLLNKHDDMYRNLMELLVQTGRFAEAHEVLSMLKEYEYSEFIRRDGMGATAGTHAFYTGDEAQWVAQLQSLLTSVSALSRRADRVDGVPVVADETAARELATAKAAIAALLDAMARQLPVDQARYLEQTRLAQEKQVAERRHQLATMGDGDNTAYVTYLLLGDRVRVIVSRKIGETAREIRITESALFPLLVAFRKKLEDPGQDPRPPARELFDILVKPIEKDLVGVNTLMLSLDGALRYIPFAALHDGQRYMVQRFRLALYTPVANGKSTQVKMPWKVAGLGLTRAIDGFSALPSVRQELQGIFEVSGGRGAIYLDGEFTAQRVQNILQQGFSVLHIASHFQFTSGTETESFLLLGDGTHLTMQDIRRGNYLFDQLDLLILSACATAMEGGKSSDGKDVEGLALLARRKGAKSVLATLWPIADMSTATFMRAFYNAKSRRGMDKAEALQKAQLALLEGEKIALPPRTEKGNTAHGGSPRASGRKKSAKSTLYAHPFFWAPFILMGEWR